ncbi:medium subunit of the adaptin 2 complex [Babesia ovis]|uniref:Medium subunit of the adaptin 2 complex n=1 Tax=Babesia ovis TaxID=5869 RepID=A0A9W5T9U3_BABOV|nr:medium subunit of the adaptin 2 complex [Babesia ovis]
MISSIFITNHGAPLLFRAYSGECTRQDAVLYAKNAFNKSLGPFKPIQQFAFTTYISVELERFYIVASCNGNVNVMLVVQCLNDIRNAIISLLDSNITESNLLNNVTLLHELLDLAIEAGYPQDFYLQYMTGNATKEGLTHIFKKHNVDFVSYIQRYGVDYNKYIRSKKAIPQIDESGSPSSSMETPTRTKSTWKSPKLILRKNEVRLQVTECLNCCFSYAGELLHSEATGSITMECVITGGLNLDIRLNTDFTSTSTRNDYKRLDFANEIEFPPPSGATVSTTLTDFKVDRIVNIESMLATKKICLTPPQGTTLLAIYRSEINGQLPFKIKPVLTRTAGQIVYYHITVETHFCKKLYATNVALNIPLPENTANVDIITHSGHCLPKLAQNVLHWHMGKVYGNTVLTLEIQCKLLKSYTDKNTTLEPLELFFELANYSLSGLYVRNLSVTNNVHRTVKNVHYNTLNGEFHYKLKLPK